MADLIACAKSGKFDSVLHVGEDAVYFSTNSKTGDTFMNLTQGYGAIKPVMPSASVSSSYLYYVGAMGHSTACVTVLRVLVVVFYYMLTRNILLLVVVLLNDWRANSLYLDVRRQATTRRAGPASAPLRSRSQRTTSRSTAPASTAFRSTATLRITCITPSIGASRTLSCSPRRRTCTPAPKRS